MKIEVREVNLADKFKILRLLFPHLKDKTNEDISEGNVFKQWEPKFRELIESEAFQSFVAVEQEKVVGTITCYKLPRLELLSYYVVIEDVFVGEDFRRKGVGSLLVQAVLDFCRENHIGNLILNVDPQNTGAINLYSKYGFKYNSNGMQLKL